MQLLRPVLLSVLALAVASACERPIESAHAGTVVTVYKSPTCGCCNGWIDHLKAAGFEVVAHDRSDMSAIKQERGIPSDLGSCHTAEVGGYVVEGHVPPADITRLLREAPPLRGIAVPGMPEGSPGMEGPNPEAYQVIGFDERGERSVFETHTPNP